MKHLGERVTALVDDQLDHDARDLALAHLARCPACQAAVEAERQVSSRLKAMDGPEPSAELIGKLFELAGTGGPLPPPRLPFPGTTPPAHAGWRPVANGGGRAQAPRVAAQLTRRTGVRYALAGSVSAGALAVALASLGGPGPDRPVVPPTEQFTVEHAKSTGVLPFSDPSSVVVPTGFSGWAGGSEP